MGGTKCKIEIARIEKKTVKSVTFTKRRNGLFRKASQLCLLSPSTQIAILATPSSSNSHASFYSFGHSSVDHVVSSLLRDQTPIQTTNQDDKNGLAFWWEDEAFDRSENAEDLKNATEAVTRMLNNVRIRLDERVKSDHIDECLKIDHEEEEKEELELPKTESNKNKEIMKVAKFEDLFENGEDVLHIDDFFADVTIDHPFF